MDEEIKKLRRSYSIRDAAVGDDRYDILKTSVWKAVQERQRVLIGLLNAHLRIPVSEARVLEVGCGHGHNLAELIRLGFQPRNLTGNDLIEERLTRAKLLLPDAVTLCLGDATRIDFPEHSFDIVYQSTVFSSILSDDFQTILADTMWKWVRPGGGLLWYDFTYNNPANRDVRGVPLTHIRQLFPSGKLHARRVTLAPPLSRRVCKVHPLLYDVFNSVSLLRTHLFCWIEKA